MPFDFIPWTDESPDRVRQYQRSPASRKHAYDTDAVGNITTRGGTDYDYDALNRLTEEDDSSAINYTYDATHNRLTRVDGGTTTTTVPATSNKISAVGSDAYSYDDAGNIIDDSTREYVWDDAGRLKEVKISSSTVGEYTYNASNQRAIKDASSTVTHYIYGAGGLLYGEYDDNGDMIREYVYLNNEPLAQITTGSPEFVTYLHTDNLGTPRFGTNTGGTQVWAWAPDAFGVGTPSGSATVHLRMPGQYFDAESGLFYNWNRYYNPAIGRYISSDPIGLEGGINTFLYAEANPVLYSDPEGLQTAPIFVPGAPPIILPPIFIPGTPENDAWVQAAEQGLQAVGEGIKGAIDWCVGAVTSGGGPPGNCTPEEHRDLQNRVENACGAAKACRGGDDIATLNRKIGLHSACITARQNINNRCFGGGDASHRDYIEQRKSAIRNCQNFMTNMGR